MAYFKMLRKISIKKMFLISILALSLVGAYQLTLTLRAAEGAARIKLATLVPRGTSLHQILQTMGDKWTKTSNGNVAITIYADGTMGSEADMVRRMRAGQIQAAMLSVGGMSEIEESVRGLQNMPMMFRSLEEVDYIREKLRPKLEKRFLEKGFVVLFWGDVGWIRFFSKKPAVLPDDFKKLKMFVWSGDNHQIDIMKAAGYHPVPLEFTDTLMGLQTGLIEAVPAAPFYALAGQFYNPAPHMLEVNWAPLVGGTVILKKTWDALSSADREAFLKAATEAGEQIKTKSRAESIESVEAMKKRGLTVHSVSPEAENQWRVFAEGIYPKIRGSIVPADMFDEVQHLLKEYRASNEKPKS